MILHGKASRLPSFAEKKIVAKKEQEKGRKLTCCVTTFGCQMNARDSEKLLGILKQIGYDLPVFDFSLPGVCSITVDPHKMGLAPIPAGGIIFSTFISISLMPFASRTLPLNDGSALSSAFSWALFTITRSPHMYPMYFAVLA